jgi:hypothetical protein
MQNFDLETLKNGENLVGLGVDARNKTYLKTQCEDTISIEFCNNILIPQVLKRKFVPTQILYFWTLFIVLFLFKTTCRRLNSVSVFT